MVLPIQNGENLQEIMVFSIQNGENLQETIVLHSLVYNKASLSHL